MAQTFFYDEQIRRFLLQFIRAFSNFQVEYGKDRDGNKTLLTVPVRYGDATRMVSSLIRENSENKMIPTPMISCYITGLEYNRDRIQDPTFVDKKHIRMRNFNPDTGEYGTVQGNAYTIERMMPVPYTLQLNVDIWTSNTTQKLQLLEQILVLFNPSLEIQSTDNYLDWTSLSVIELQNTTWSNRSVPVGADDTIDIASLSFTVPIWITAPGKVKKLGVIKKIVAGIFDPETIVPGFNDTDADLIQPRMKFTPMDYGVLLVGNTLKILEKNEPVTNTLDYDILQDPPTKLGGDDVNWKTVVNIYGELQAGISQVRLELEDGTEVVGTVAYHPSDDYTMLFTVDTDTTPTNSLIPVNRIINPQKSAPGAGLPAPIPGVRYLILTPIGSTENSDGPDAWKSNDGVTDLVAGANDIIEWQEGEFTGIGSWSVVFDSSANSGVQYVTNTNTGIQYKWTGSTWVKSYEGEYKGGYWSLVI